MYTSYKYVCIYMYKCIYTDIIYIHIYTHRYYILPIYMHIYVSI